MIEEPLYSVVALVARILMALVFLVSCIEKTIKFEDALDEYAKVRVPFVKFTVIGVNVFHLVASICLIAGWLVMEMSVALALFTFLATIRVHDFWNMEGEEQVIRSRIALANFAVVGGLLLLAATGPGSLVLQGG
jgi:putative oxidoreductase